MTVSLKWITPDAEAMIVHMARVSNPEAKEGDPGDKLIKYLINHKHWSPFEMACACLEIHTTRDIARQILRHRSFHFQEFSQRYSKVDANPILSDTRFQDEKNRQNSIESNDKDLNIYWSEQQNEIWVHAYAGYKCALAAGVAKELARKLLPEGLTPTHMYMQGTIRDWIHYIAIRTEEGSQFEHRQIAAQALTVLEQALPGTFLAAKQSGIIGDYGDALRGA